MAKYIFIELTPLYREKLYPVNASLISFIERGVDGSSVIWFNSGKILEIDESPDQIADRLREVGLLPPQKAELVQEVQAIDKPASPADGVGFICQSNLMRKCKEWCGEEVCDLGNNPF